MADAEEVVSNEEMLFVPSLVLVLALSRFTRATQRRKHIKRKHKKKERFTFLVLASMLALMLSSSRFTRWFLVLVLASYV